MAVGDLYAEEKALKNRLLGLKRKCEDEAHELAVIKRAKVQFQYEKQQLRAEKRLLKKDIAELEKEHMAISHNLYSNVRFTKS